MPDIIVCMKVIIDPEAPTSIFKLDRENRKPVPPVGMPPVFSPFDLNALEAALKIKDKQTCKITILSLGKSIPKALLQKALAMGADEAITIEGNELEHLDPLTTAHTLVEAIRKIGAFDLVCTGRQAADWDSGQVWAAMAELLNLPCITMARAAQLESGKAVVERCVSDGIETVECDLPALLTFSSEVGEARYASLPALMKVKKKEIPKWTPQELGFTPQTHQAWQDLYEPDFGKITCTWVTGATAEEKGRHLAKIIIDQMATLDTREVSDETA
jgi:electron transfer flavoprotein beta subunit